MKVLSIIDSFKGTITSKRLSEITKEVLEQKGHFCKGICVADGGDGFLDAISDIIKKEDQEIKDVMVNDPLFRVIKSYYIIDKKNKVCYVELAKASGINLLTKDELNPYVASTYGLGEMIFDCIKSGYKKIVVGIGGSATNDGGSGMLEALGCKFYDDKNNEIKHIKNKDFFKINKIDETIFKANIQGIEFIVLSDVMNPLLGEFGATNVFSRQKGATESDLKLLEKNMTCYSSFHKEEITNKGSGAAGGVGYAFHAYFKAKFFSGIDYILDLIDYDNLIKDYDYIITGEGKIDNQSLLGKVIFRISSRSNNKKVILVCAINELENIDLKDYNIDQIYSIVNDKVSKDKVSKDKVSKEDSMSNPEYYYQKMVEEIKL